MQDYTLAIKTALWGKYEAVHIFVELCRIVSKKHPGNRIAARVLLIVGIVGIVDGFSRQVILRTSVQ